MGLGRHLGGIGGGLAGTLETDVASRGPGQDLALLVGDGDDRVVEAGLDVGDAVGDVLALTLAGPTAPCTGLRHYSDTFSVFCGRITW